MDLQIDVIVQTYKSILKKCFTSLFVKKKSTNELSRSRRSATVTQT